MPTGQIEEEKVTNLKEAKDKRLKFYYPGKICRNGHLSKRYTVNRDCYACHQARWLSDYHKERTRNYKKKPEIKELYSSLAKEEYKRNRDKRLAYSERFRNSEYGKQTIKAWKNNNRDKVAKYTSHRNYAKRSCTPKWLSEQHIKDICALYAERDRLNKIHGKRAYHVDHIVPIKGKNVCGLHVPWNLRVITGVENLRKANKF